MLYSIVYEILQDAFLSFHPLYYLVNKVVGTRLYIYHQLVNLDLFSFKWMKNKLKINLSLSHNFWYSALLTVFTP